MKIALISLLVVLGCGKPPVEANYKRASDAPTLATDRTPITYPISQDNAQHGSFTVPGRPREVNCPDEADRAVMNKVMNSFPQYNSAYGNVPRSYLNKERNDIERMFKWSQGIKDRTIRDCYESWLWYYDYELDDPYEAANKLKLQQRYEETHKIPSPPKSK
jgi:hypothetical protein